MVERSAGAVVFYRDKEGLKYLLLRHEPLDPRIQAGGEKEYWNFSKGRIKKGEKSEATALREIREETGLENLTILPGFKETERYVYAFKGEKIYKWVVWFLAETHSKKIKLSFEHIDSVWLPYAEALKRATYHFSKKLLTRAHEFLSQEQNKP